jgi:hypothetical protein
MHVPRVTGRVIVSQYGVAASGPETKGQTIAPAVRMAVFIGVVGNEDFQDCAGAGGRYWQGGCARWKAGA